MISVRILAPDLVEVTVRPSWWRRLLGAETHTLRVERTERYGGWCWSGTWCKPDAEIRLAIYLAFAAEADQRRAETARNYQAAAQRGEYPIR